MLYLSGAWVPDAPADLGWMATPRQRDPLRKATASRAWAADNDCYNQGDAFDLDAFLAWLDRLRPAQPGCVFAVAPDVVGAAAATIARSLPVLDVIRTLGYPAAFVGQDGQEDLPVPWGAFDAWFTGGSTEWKLSRAAYELAAEAKARGKWVHMGRVNSRKRLGAALRGGYDSCDGTIIRFGPRIRVPEVAGWVREARDQGRLCA